MALLIFRIMSLIKKRITNPRITNRFPYGEAIITFSIVGEFYQRVIKLHHAMFGGSYRR